MSEREAKDLLLSDTFFREYLMKCKKVCDGKSVNRWRKQMVKYVFVTGGVVSGLGKGITAASLEDF